MHDDPFFCLDCDRGFYWEAEYARHVIQCRAVWDRNYKSRQFDPAPSEAQIEEAREDLVALLDELS